MDRKDGITHVLALPVFSVVSFHSFSIFSISFVLLILFYGTEPACLGAHHRHVSLDLPIICNLSFF